MVSVSLSPQLWVGEQNGRGGSDGGYAWAKEHELPFSQAELDTTTANMAPFPGVISQLPSGTLFTLDCCYYGRGSIWFFVE